jgi:hypothetical protein
MQEKVVRRRGLWYKMMFYCCVKVAFFRECDLYLFDASGSELEASSIQPNGQVAGNERTP